MAEYAITVWFSFQGHKDLANPSTEVKLKHFHSMYKLKYDKYSWLLIVTALQCFE